MVAVSLHDRGWCTEFQAPNLPPCQEINKRVMVRQLLIHKCESEGLVTYKHRTL